MELIEVSILLAKFWGYLLAILGLLFLLKKNALESLLKRVQDKTFIVLSGYFALILGLITIVLHNVWVAEWMVVITILGWVSLIKGIVRIGFPEVTKEIVNIFKNKLIIIQALLVFTTILGIWIIWISY